MNNTKPSTLIIAPPRLAGVTANRCAEIITELSPGKHIGYFPCLTQVLQCLEKTITPQFYH